MQLEDRYYTSTEVADILGVSLRSVYRYMEDDKLKAEIKTATGRHRFTRQNILDFLYPDGGAPKMSEEDEKSEQKTTVKIEEPEKVEVKTEDTLVKPEEEDQSEKEEEIKEEESEDEEEVDWLAKFREAASKYKEEEEKPQTEVRPSPTQPQQPAPQSQPTPQPQPEPQPAPQQTTQQVHNVSAPQQPAPQPAQTASAPNLMYYRSMLGGLKDIAQNLDKSARNSNLEYAFTLHAGASLHKPVKPFATLHSYIQSSDRDFFEKILRLTPSNKDNAQLCLIISDDSTIYNNKEEVHGLFVVSKAQLKKDIATFGESALAQEMADVL